MAPARKNFDDLYDARPLVDFDLRGVTFTCRREVAPEAILGFERMTPDMGLEETMAVLDNLVLAVINPDEHAAYRDLRRLDSEKPALGLATLQELSMWLIEQVVARPTEAPSSSSGGSRTRRTGTPSTVGSHSPVAVASAG